MDKAQSLLADTTTYRAITMDPTNKLKYKFSQTPRDIKCQGELSDYSYRKVYPTSAVAPNFYSLSKIHKIGNPLGPLCPVGGPPHMGGQGAGQHHLPHSWPVSTPSQNTQHFIQHSKEVKLEPGEVMTFYDVKAIFTSVPMDPSINIVKHRLQ